MLDYALRIFTENSKKTEHYLHDTWFSDNITLIQNFRENAEVLLISIEIATKIVLHVNEIETDCFGQQKSEMCWWYSPSMIIDKIMEKRYRR